MWFKKQEQIQEDKQKSEKFWKFIKELDEYKEKMIQYIPTISEHQIRTELKQSSTAEDKNRLLNLIEQEEESMLKEYNSFLEKINDSEYEGFLFHTYIYRKTRLNEAISSISKHFNELRYYIWSYVIIPPEE